MSQREQEKSRRTLPKTGIPAEEIAELMVGASAEDVDWEHGRVAALVYMAGDDVTLFLDGVGYRLKRAGLDLGEADAEAAALKITAPMPGRIIAVHVAAGKTVEKGAALIVLEAMKMEHTLKAGHAGKIEYVGCKPGDQIREGQELLRFAAPA